MTTPRKSDGLAADLTPNAERHVGAEADWTALGPLLVALRGDITGADRERVLSQAREAAHGNSDALWMIDRANAK